MDLKMQCWTEILVILLLNHPSVVHVHPNSVNGIVGSIQDAASVLQLSVCSAQGIRAHVETIGAPPGLGFNAKCPEQPEQTNSTITCDQIRGEVAEQVLKFCQRHVPPDMVYTLCHRMPNFF